MREIHRRSARSGATLWFRPLNHFALILIVASGSVAAAGADPPPRRRAVMRPPPLQVSAPVVPSPLISGVEAVIPLPHTYSGSGALVFRLVEGGAGMAVDARNGVLRWTPPVAAEGSSTTVRVEVTDGKLRSEVTFGLPVAASSPLPVSVAGQTATLAGPGTLAGIALTIPSDATLPPSNLNASRVEPRDAPGLPTGFTRISDYFRLTPASSGDSPIILTIPDDLVPAGDSPQQVRLMVHTDATTEAEQREWLAVWKHLDVRPDGSITIEISTLGELFTIAIADSPQTSVSKSRAVSEANVTCVPVELSNGATDASRQVCTVSVDPALTFIIKDHARAEWGPVASPPEIAGWLAAARDAALETGLFCKPSLEVVIEPMARDWGFVSSVENFEVLHINSTSIPRDLLQGTLVHELFHHAQSNTIIRERNNLVRECGPGCNWIIEGTARWFEDVVFDELDTYRSKESSPLSPILSAGLDAWPDADRLASRPYSRFAFFKLLSSRCPSLDVAQMVNAELAFDPTGIEALAGSLDRWGCHFAEGLTGAWHDSLEAALLEYVYATIGENSMPWLDDDENGFDFANSNDLIRPDRDCKVSGLCPSRSVTAGTMPPSSAFGIRVAAVESLPEHSEAAIVLRSSNGSLIAWVGNDEEGTLDDGQWIVVDDTVIHPYTTSLRAPRTLVIVVNSGRAEADRVEIRSIVRSLIPGTTTTPVDLAWSYHPANPVMEKAVASHVIWNSTVTGSITAPDTASVASYTEPYQWENQKRMMACVPNSTAFTVEMEAALTATSSELEGQAPHPTIEGALLEWRYSNPHLMILQNEPTGSVTGSGVTFTIPVVKGATFGRVFGACVAYDLQIWVINPDGSRTGGGVSPDLCQTTFVLDLRVGNPPPGCPNGG